MGQNRPRGERGCGVGMRETQTQALERHKVKSTVSRILSSQLHTFPFPFVVSEHRDGNSARLKRSRHETITTTEREFSEMEPCTERVKYETL